ncbi:MAG TPA: hypothetical protein VJS38_02145 [Phenylobacterium sp.]|uniref:hypothetical protein n=1 Tax=Phenylobacterium sp. TaxID=1871053 RepID=UPI002B48BEE0|nr:hypothetical protein [Phenylobacterium sp.]HKR86949.1 hypothetical protein [Phenylobacterium sp.]
MALKAHTREVLFCDLIVKRRAQHAPFPEMSKLVALWKRAADQKLPPKLFDKGEASCIINEVRIDEARQIVTILLSVADKRAPDQTYGNHVKRSSRTVAKEADEGNEHSAHLVISLTHRPNYPETYACLVERVPTLSIPRVQSMLNDVVKRYCEIDPSLFSFNAVSGAKAKVQNFIPNIILAGNPSAAFQRDIEEGRINGLRLIKSMPKQSLGSGNYLELSDLEVKVNVSKLIPPGQRWATILQAVQTQKATYSRAKMYLAPAGSDSAASFEFDTDTGAIIGEAYVRRQSISNIDPVLRSATDKIVDHLAMKMVALLEKERTG